MRLSIRIATRLGPRTIVTQGLAREDAEAIAEAIRGAMGGTHPDELTPVRVLDEGPEGTISQVLRRRNAGKIQGVVRMAKVK